LSPDQGCEAPGSVHHDVRLSCLVTSVSEHVAHTHAQPLFDGVEEPTFFARAAPSFATTPIERALAVLAAAIGRSQVAGGYLTSVDAFSLTGRRKVAGGYAFLVTVVVGSAIGQREQDAAQ
jgi:hypothetical protein